MDELKDLIEQITEEVLKDTENLMWNLARNTKIPGYDPEDLMQEMRTKIWQTIRDNNYDPERVKPTSFYYRVCKRHLINLNASRIYKYKNSHPEKRQYRDILDTKVNISDEMLTEIDEIPLSFVQNFSKDFARLVLPSEELIEESNEEGRAA